jgi:hypothetical protein
MTRTPTVRTTVVALALAALLWPAAQARQAEAKKKPKPPRCDHGRFLVQQGPLVIGGAADQSDAITVASPEVGLDGLCPARAASVLKATAKGTRLQAAWKTCEGPDRVLKGVKLRALIAPDCESMVGRIVGKRRTGRKFKKFKRKFRADATFTTTTVVGPTTTTVPIVPFIRWTTPPPGSVAEGQSFPLGLEVTSEGRTCSGPAASVAGTIVACPGGVSRYECEDPYPFSLTPNDGGFQGPPQTHAFTARRTEECAPPGAYYFGATVYLADPHGAYVIGPFFGPEAPTELAPAAAPALVVGCGGYGDGDLEPPLLAFHALAGGGAPRPQQLVFGPRCGEPFSWTAAASASWVRVSPSSGSTGDGCQLVSVAVDPAGLAPSLAPYEATVTLAAAGGASAVVVPIAFHLRGGVSVQVTSPPPPTIATPQAFSLGFMLASTDPNVSGELRACPVGGTPDDCSSDEPLSIEEGGFFFGTGPVQLRIARDRDCQSAADYTFVADLFFDGADGELLGPFPLPLPATTRLLDPTSTDIELTEEEITFSARAGQPVPAREIGLVSTCGQTVRWSAAADQPWLQVTPPTGQLPGADSVRVAVNPAALAPSTTAYRGRVTVTPSGGPSRAVDVTLHLRDDVTIAWSGGPPPTVATGQEFELALTIGAGAPSVFADIAACRTTVPPEDCFGTGPFDLPGELFGPPGIFRVPVRRGADCENAGDYYFVARLSLDADFDEIGPFLGPPAVTALLAPSGQPLLVGPGGLEFSAWGRTPPAPRRLVVRGGCGSPIEWTATSSAPWVRVRPGSGSAGPDGADEATVEIDVSSLDAAQSPFQATLTFTAPGAPPVSIPVLLDLAC